MFTKKKLALVLTAVIGLVVIETGRELAVYLSWSRHYEKAYWTIDGRRQNDSVTKSELVEIAGPPSSQENSGVETWYWDSASHRGPIIRILPLPMTRRTYRLSVEFDTGGLVKDVYSHVE